MRQLSSPELTFFSFEAEFFWAKAILTKNAEDIRRFQKLAMTFSEKLLQGEEVEAKKALDDIESEFGWSLWLIKNKLAFLQQFEGLEAQKTLVGLLKNELKNNSLQRFIVHWLSVRNERQTSVNKFTSQIDPILSRLNPASQSGYKEYCNYHLLGTHHEDPEKFIQVLRLEYSSSPIDYYEAFVHLLMQMYVSNNPVFIGMAQSTISSHSEELKNSKLHLLYNLNQYTNQGVVKQSIAWPLEGFLTSGETLSIGELKQKIGKGESVEAILVNSAINFAISDDAYLKFESDINELIDSTILSYRILGSMIKVLREGPQLAIKEFTFLSKTSLNFNTLPWSSMVGVLLAAEAEQLEIPKNDFINQAIAAGVISPILMQYFRHSKIYESYQSRCSADLNQRNTHALYSGNIVSNIPSISNDLKGFQFLQIAILSLHEKNFYAALENSRLLLNEENGYVRRNAISIAIRAFLKMQRNAEAFELAASCYIGEKGSYSYLPLKELSVLCIPGTAIWETLNQSIDLPIILDAIYKYSNKALETERRFAYEDYLLNNGIEKPTELKVKLSDLGIDKTIYYLRHVCLESVMDTSSAFDGGSIQVMEERLQICRTLLLIDPSNEDIYKSEIAQLVRRQVITNRRHEVDQSRIYVDLESIKTWAYTDLKENFERYIAYLKMDLEKGDSFDTKSVNEKQVRETDTKNGITIPENEVQGLLKSMIEELRDAYLSPDFGLDRFLSTRIRHGNLERHLRKPIQKQHLITKKENRSGPYLGNEFWLKKLNGQFIDIKQISKAFTTFSAAFDKQIQSILDEWLQTQKFKGDKGLFNFIISNEDIVAISHKFDKDTTFDEFLNLGISLLESTLIINLIRVRNELNDVAKPKAKQLLSDLQTHVGNPTNTIIIELQRAISEARTDLQIQYDSVIEWFVPPSTGSSAPYQIEDAILVAEALIKEDTSEFSTVISKFEDDPLSIHGQLPIFVDIFVNIFENVVKRSGLDFPHAEVEISGLQISPECKMLSVNVMNTLGPSIQKQSLISDLLQFQAEIDAGTYQSQVAKERKSGLFKIHKSVMDFKAPGLDFLPELKFEVVNECFNIKISVPFRLVVLQNT